MARAVKEHREGSDARIDAGAPTCKAAHTPPWAVVREDAATTGGRSSARSQASRFAASQLFHPRQRSRNGSANATPLPTGGQGPRSPAPPAILFAYKILTIRRGLLQRRGSARHPGAGENGVATGNTRTPGLSPAACTRRRDECDVTKPASPRAVSTCRRGWTAASRSASTTASSTRIRRPVRATNSAPCPCPANRAGRRGRPSRRRWS